MLSQRRFVGLRFRFTATKQKNMQSSEDFLLSPMSYDDLDALGTMAARSFSNDPGFSFIFPEEETRFEKQKWLWEGMLYVSLAHQENYVMKHGSKIIGMVCPMYPSDAPDTIWTEIKAGLLKFPFVAGRKSFNRAMLTAGKSKELKKDINEVSNLASILMFLTAPEIFID